VAWESVIASVEPLTATAIADHKRAAEVARRRRALPNVPDATVM
jgi:hypothetical protein